MTVLAIVSLAPALVLEPSVLGVAMLTEWKATVNGRPAFVQSTLVNLDHENWSWDTKGSPSGLVKFGFSGKVKVVLTPSVWLSSARVEPVRPGVTSKVANGRIEILLEQPADLIITPDVRTKLPPIHVFAGDLDVNREPKMATFTFGPGLHTPGEIRITADNSVVFLAAGAVVRGHITADNVSGIKIVGSGTLDGSNTQRNVNSNNLIKLVGCRDVLIDGPTLLDNPTWNVVLAGCHGVKIRRVRILAARATSDGFDIVNSSDVSIDRSFVRNFDDAVALKGIEEFRQGPLPVKNVSVTRSVFHCDNAWAGPFAVGYETYSDAISNFSVVDCDVTFCRMLLRLLVADQGSIKGVLFENVRVNMPIPREPLRFVVGRDQYTQWYKNHREATGSITDVTFRKVSITGGPWSPSVLEGKSEKSAVRSITFDGVLQNGRPFTRQAANLKENAFVQDVVFR